MVLGKDNSEKIKELVKKRPRAVSEIAEALGTSWKTAERYVEAIKASDGCLETHTFRQGTRGALKIVFWSLGEFNLSDAEKIIYDRLMQGRKKEDFSPLDIYQFVDSKQKTMEVFEKGPGEQELVFRNFKNLLESAKERVLAFSGNISWINSSFGKENATRKIQALIDRGVDFKVISRVELPSVKNLESVYSINRRSGRDAIEIRHFEQPLRGFIIDDKIVSLKERKKPEDYKSGELENDIVIFYRFQEKKWVDFLQGVFWKYWQNAFSAEKRLENLKFMRPEKKQK